MGYIVAFFNEICGLLPFSDIEEVHKESRGRYVMGQTLQVFVSFVNAETKKIGLSLSAK